MVYFRNSSRLSVKSDEIDALDGAGFGTLAAACALAVINLCAEVLDLDCAEFASLDALHTADTAVCTFLSGDCALVVIGAEVCCLCLMERHHLNNMVRAGLETLFTCLAHCRIDSCNSVADVNSLIRAGSYAVAETDTSVNTFLRTAEKLFRHLAGFNTVVLHLDFCLAAEALTHYDSR